MASSSLSFAQDVIRCSDCDSAAEYHCKFCHVNLCSECTSEHLSDRSKIHEVVEFTKKEDAKEKYVCHSHESSNCEIYCKKCNIPICSKCVFGDHKKHAFTGLDDILAERKRAMFEDIIEIASSLLPKFKKQRAIIEKENIENIIEAIFNQEESICDAVRDFGSKLRVKITEHKKELQKKENENILAEKQMIDVLDETKRLHKSNDTKSILSYIGIKSELRNIPHTFNTCMPNFDVNRFQEEEIASLFGTLEIRADAKDKQLTTNLVVPIGSENSIEEQNWFHGVLPRDEVQHLLTKEGDFLVMDSKNWNTHEPQYVLSVFWHGQKHFIIQYADNGWRFEGRSFPTVAELVHYHQFSGEAVTTKSQTILKNPIIREQWQLKNDDIALEIKIGNGTFGEIHKGVYKPKSIVVAVKTCRDSLSENEWRDFLQDGMILKQYNHPNIVRFIGITAQRHPVMIVMEYVEGGDLLNFLRIQDKTFSKKQLTKMCEDVASGMAYLESKQCIHRDLAARNCLVGYKLVVKISDFRMSRQGEEYVVSEGPTHIPIKRTAPEALLYGKYTSLCDVWSFGILMWEIFSGGFTPYPGVLNREIRELIDRGYRMPAPRGTPEACYDLMMKCWEYNPNERYHFNKIHMELQSILKSL